MARLPDLVEYTLLDTQYEAEYTCHTYREAGSSSRRATKVRKECWKRQKSVGRGGFGEVWLEKCENENGKVEVRAVKQFLRPVKPIDCARELLAIAFFSQPKYAQCFVRSSGWFVNAEDYLCIAMEYLPHGDLQDYLSKFPLLSEKDTKEIVSQILEGLTFMHSNAFAHRDLKPGNILIQSQPPNEWWVKITDFGISKRTEAVSAGPTTFCGTQPYLAPEVYGHKPNEDEKATMPKAAVDMWALGAITFRMLTNLSPFANPYELMKYTEGDCEFPSLTLKSRDISVSGLDFIKSLLDPMPKARMTVYQACKHTWIMERPSLGSVLAPVTRESSIMDHGLKSRSENRLEWLDHSHSLNHAYGSNVKMSPHVEHDKKIATLGIGSFLLNSARINGSTSPDSNVTKKESQIPSNLGYHKPSITHRQSDPPHNPLNKKSQEPQESLKVLPNQTTNGKDSRWLIAALPEGCQEAGPEIDIWDEKPNSSKPDRQQVAGISLDGKYIATTSFGHPNVKLIDMSTGLCFQTLETYYEPAHKVYFSPCSNFVAIYAYYEERSVRNQSGGRKGAVEMWQIHGNLLWARLAPDWTTRPFYITFSPNEKIVAIQDETEFEICNTHHGTYLVMPIQKTWPGVRSPDAIGLDDQGRFKIAEVDDLGNIHIEIYNVYPKEESRIQYGRVNAEIIVRYCWTPPRSIKRKVLHWRAVSWSTDLELVIQRAGGSKHGYRHRHWALLDVRGRSIMDEVRVSSGRAIFAYREMGEGHIRTTGPTIRLCNSRLVVYMFYWSEHRLLTVIWCPKVGSLSAETHTFGWKTPDPGDRSRVRGTDGHIFNDSSAFSDHCSFQQIEWLMDGRLIVTSVNRVIPPSALADADGASAMNRIRISCIGRYTGKVGSQ